MVLAPLIPAPPMPPYVPPDIDGWTWLCIAVTGVILAAFALSRGPDDD